MPVDTAALKQRLDLLGLLGRDTRLRKVASTAGGEWAVPCPFCGGRDRFRVQPYLVVWWCRQCGGQRWSDAIDYLVRRDGVSFVEACRQLGASRSELDAGRLRAERAESVANELGLQRATDVRLADYREAPAAWQVAALALVEHSEAALPKAEHLLDWFHVTMRITLMGQLAKGLRSHEIPNLAPELAEELERLKWYLWHGNVFLALQTIDYLQLHVDNEDPSPEQHKLRKAITDFGGYIRANGAWIPNYGERYRSGEAISSAFVESAVNQVASKRMVKKQQMRWTPKGLSSSRSVPAS